MNTESKLARAFRAVAGQEKQMESTASKILAIIRGAKALTISRFDKLVEQAYDANGWNSRPGRPNSKDTPKDSVPGTVRTYVTVIRRAMRLRLKVGKFKTFHALREALEVKLAASAEAGTSSGPSAAILRLPAPVQENLRGVDIDEPKRLTGAVVHDVGVVYATLPEAHQAVFGRQLERLLKKYMPLVPQRLLKDLTAKDAKAA
jgi:hypothetical protein